MLKIYTKISLTELVNRLVLFMLPIYFNVLVTESVHDCIGYHWLSVNENLCLINSIKKVVGWSQLRWNCQKT